MIDLAPDEIIVDSFAGGGGTSEGVEWVFGRGPDIAINHDAKALAMHRINHPDTQHVCENVWKADIKALVNGRRVGLAWFSPDCKHFSKAKGGKPVEKKIRGLAWVALRWAGLVRPRVIILENVEEFRDWGPVLTTGQPCRKRKGMTFKRWCTQLRNLGYKLEHRERRASWDGAPTIRKRLFVIARNDGKPIVWPERTHGNGEGLKPYRTAAECIDWSLPCPSIFLSKGEGRAIGVNRPLADATMERIAKGVFKYVLNAAEPFIVNFSHGGSSQPTGQPLTTICTEKGGSRAIVTPVLGRVAHGERDKTGKKRGQGTHSLTEPLGTVTASPEFALLAPSLMQYYGTNRDGGERTADIKEPLLTVTVENRHALIAPVLMHNNTHNRASSPTDPLKTVTTGNRHFEVAAFLSRQFGKSVGGDVAQPAPTTTAGGGGKTAQVAVFMAQHNTERNGAVKPGRPANEPLSTVTMTGRQQSIVAANILKMRGTNIGHAADEPLQTISAGGTHFAAVNARLVPVAEGDFPESAYLVAAFLMKYYRTDQDPRLSEPLASVTTKDRFAVVMVTIRGEDYVIVDIGMRMLTPRELFRAQGFPDSYVIDRGIRVASHGDTGDLFATEITLTRTEQIRMCGNSVSPYSAAAIIRAQFTPSFKEAAA